MTVVVAGRSKTLALVGGRATLTSQKLKKAGKVTVTATYAATSSTQASTATAKIKVKKKHRKHA